MSEAGNSGPDSLATGKAAAYRVLARKYRPSNFSELVGQEPMVRTLTNAFATGRIAQAWMLTGVRGVGKTTTARILARALNYKTATVDQPSVDLAVLGEHCQAIMEGRHVDVIEMDAASHTGIDDIRDIIERVRYAPVSARYKVYIIDEVHMLSTQAFNGLLKTLEEPPPHVKFIFATTEIRKVPITVLSRCQRFDLRRIDAGALVAHLSSIAGKEGISVDDDALAMIARAAEGSARDSLSILDQAIAHGAGSVSAEAVRAMLGLADRARIVDLFEHVMKGDVAAALGEFRAQYDTGADPAAVLTDLAEFNHLVTRLRFVPTAMDDASLSQDERQRGADFARALSVRVLSRTWQMLLKGIPEVQSSNRPVSAAEMVLIRLAHAADLPTLDEALRSLESGASATGAAPRPNGAPVNPGNGGPGGNGASAVAQARMPGGSGGAQTMRLVEAAPAPAAFVAPPRPAPETQAVPLKSLADIVALADAQRDVAFKVLVKRCIRLVRIEPGRIDVGLTDDAPKMLLNELTTKLRAWTGRSWLVSLSKEEGGQTLAEMESTKRENAFLDARNDPTVAAFLTRFPGAKIIDVRIPDTPDAEASEAEMPVEPPADDDEP
ncbi:MULTISPECIES: DNA polymerase III subunit gamma/tau [unclassified Mesorhizobium]|uniref:DNA polymerase III subunit gamma/tau n=1 Tax=unclassified Mesorhizobium TaxID=325217 RepID=UPI000FDC1575|nr:MULTISPECIES: DNA polymerase III subunit gamma/tau [unclassified Mesorhizobium]TGR38292.1 DNA polymerase III subunit gamma/tau [bacterium M00.F.Ca.ET.199.01.1.1]TGU26577.1 DNA polymerase III subunit gamma/tau [bacterium M00.F.Ca.ET.156.01.1.1]TGV11793.1 DNA polymerase III subunit gamma/tau [Mesorhizobium sp. M8A.F.Ca.ET.173.01.1.1]TGV83294.1 DNA polymerase III subunit gamma/tau [Mesorhizobium sp. M00.F.Ca.ET.149.01.1.1]TGR19975.1 DNA polymerase III subunit gamma/tau [Mesorhizobium sp. M8A.F